MRPRSRAMRHVPDVSPSVILDISNRGSRVVILLSCRPPRAAVQSFRNPASPRLILLSSSTFPPLSSSTLVIEDPGSLSFFPAVPPRAAVQKPRIPPLLLSSSTFPPLSSSTLVIEDPGSLSFFPAVPPRAAVQKPRIPLLLLSSSTLVIEDPVSLLFPSHNQQPWIPAFAGMTD